MRLEDVTQDNVGELSDHELRCLRERANQLHNASWKWKEQLSKQCIGINDPIPEDQFLGTYTAICAEMDGRGLHARRTKLDKRLLRKNARKLDMASFPPIVVREDVAVIHGQFATNPMRADRADVWVDGEVFDPFVREQLEKRLGELLLTATGGNVLIGKDSSGLESPVVPLFDLVLVPKPYATDMEDVEHLKKRSGLPQIDEQGIEGSNTPLEGESVLETIVGIGDAEEEYQINLTDVSKTSSLEHLAEQLPAENFIDFRREDNKLGEGIHVIWGIGANNKKTKIQSIRIAASRMTPEVAMAWLKDHGYKSALETATKKADVFVKNAEKRIIGGVVYECNVTDSQGDFVDDAEEIWKAMESHMLAGANIKIMHEGSPVSSCPVIECFQAEVDTQKGDSVIPAGAWFLTVKVLDDQIWSAVKSGELTGFSMAGRARSTEVDD